MKDYFTRVSRHLRPERTLDGGALLAQTLVDLGVDAAFGVHGGHLDAALVGMHDRGIRLVDTRHEAVAVNAADGYARATGKLGVAFATAGAGLGNALAGITTASLDRGAVLTITSSPPLRDAETNPLQGGLDQIGLVRPITKWAHQVTVAEEIPRLVAHAARVALTGAPGPVLLDIPIDILFGPVKAEQISVGGGAFLPRPPAPSTRSITESLEFLRAAERPVIIVGSGVQGVQERRMLDELSRLLDAPVFHQPYIAGALPTDHPCFAGSTKVLSGLVADGARPDVALVLGSRFGKQLGGRSERVIPFDTEIIQVDIDPAEIGRMRPVALGITASSSEFVSAMLAAIDRDRVTDHLPWRQQAVAALGRINAAFEDQPTESAAGIHPFHAVRQVMRSVPRGSNIVVDGGEVAGWAGGLMHEADPHRGFGYGGYLGYLGIGPGLAIGTQIAEPEVPTVLIVGDGSVGFNIQEFDTFARHGLPILVVVANNSLWAMSSHGQNEIYGETGEIISHLPDTDYQVAAQAFGCRGQRIEKLADLADAIEKWIADPAPTCLNVITAGEVVHPSTVAAVGATDDPGVIVVPYYENIPV